MRDTPDRKPVHAVLLLATGACGILAAIDAPWTAWLGAFAALASLVLLAAVWRRTRDTRGLVPTGLVLVWTLVCCASEWPAPPSTAETFTQASQQVRERWLAMLAPLEAAVSNTPLAGGDFSWIDERRATLGERAGVSVLSSDAGQVISWSGWTTKLTAEEIRAVRKATVSAPSALVVRRGLALRLLCAKRNPPSGLIIVAERALPTEPDPGSLAPIDAQLTARVRWESFGEGVRADFRTDDPSTVALFSQAPLMSPDGTRKVGSVTLSALGQETVLEDQRRRRAGMVGLGFGIWIVWLVLSRSAPWWSLIPGRGFLFVSSDWLATSRFGELFAPLDGVSNPLIATPFDAATTSMLLVAITALLPLPERVASWLRALLVGIAFVGLVFGLHLVWRATTRSSLSPGEVVMYPFEGFGSSALLALALSGLTWSALLLAWRAFAPRQRRGFLITAVIAGVVAGAVHGQALERASERHVTGDLAVEIRDRFELWTDALSETLAIAIPPPNRPELAPERDAIDLWWRSPLAELGLASGVWKFEAGQPLEPVDLFLTGVPPVEIEPELTVEDPQEIGPFRATRIPPRVARYRVISVEYDLLTAEVQRPEGGSWVAAILISPSNVPSRAGLDPLRGARSGRASRAGHRDPGERLPQLAWFDQSGELLSSDLDAGPPPPRTPPLEPRWRMVDIEGRAAQVYEWPDDAVGTIAAVTFPMGILARASIAAGWGLVLVLAALPWLIARVVLFDTRAFAARVRQFFWAILRQFRVQLAVVLIVAGLLPLLALGGVGRAAAYRQARIQLTTDATRALQFARSLIEDYLSVEEPFLGNPASEETRTVAAWMSRTLGEDLFLWRNGDLIATSRPDLVRAGLWPERLPSTLWRPLTIHRRSQIVDSLSVQTLEREWSQTVAHGPYTLFPNDTGVMSIPLAGAENRFEQALIDFDRALVVSSLLLVTLALLLLIPTLRRLTTPLIELERATTHIAAGEFDYPIPETGYEETRSLSRAFREMSVSLGRQRAALHRRRAAIEALIDSIPMAVFAMTPDGLVRVANPQAQTLLALEVDAALPTDADSPLLAGVRAMLDSPVDRTRVVDVRGDDEDEESSNRRFRVSGIELSGLIEGQPARLITVEDLTDALRSERLVAWAEMARRVAHEIKNPLTPINLMVDHVRKLADEDDPRLREALDRCLTTISQQVRVLRDTARDFSDYARLLIHNPESVDLAPLIVEWLAPYVSVTDAPIRVRLEGPDTLGPIQADPRLMRRALINLVGNAFEAIEADSGRGEIVVRWEASSSPERGIVISVEDDGPGIDPQKLSQLFEPDVTTRETGTGLGLPIVREAIEAHGGRVDVDPRPGQGAVFRIFLPAGTA